MEQIYSVAAWTLLHVDLGRIALAGGRDGPVDHIVALLLEFSQLKMSLFWR